VTQNTESTQPIESNPGFARRKRIPALERLDGPDRQDRQECRERTIPMTHSIAHALLALAVAATFGVAAPAAADKAATNPSLQQTADQAGAAGRAHAEAMKSKGEAAADAAQDSAKGQMTEAEKKAAKEKRKAEKKAAKEKRKAERKAAKEKKKAAEAASSAGAEAQGAADRATAAGESAVDSATRPVSAPE
jgi:hypothetical protein